MRAATWQYGVFLLLILFHQQIFTATAIMEKSSIEHQNVCHAASGTPIFNMMYYLCVVVLIWWLVQV